MLTLGQVLELLDSDETKVTFRDGRVLFLFFKKETLAFRKLVAREHLHRHVIRMKAQNDVIILEVEGD